MPAMTPGAPLVRFGRGGCPTRPAAAEKEILKAGSGTILLAFD
jgi:hypothetical protein